VLRLRALADLPLRLAAAVAWLCALAFFGIVAVISGLAAYDNATYDGGAKDAPWVRVTGRVESVRLEHRRDLGMNRETEIVEYSYLSGGRKYAGRTEAVRWWSGSDSGALEMPNLRKGGPITLWVSESRPAKSRLDEPREPRSPWPDAWRSLGAVAAVMLATWVARRIVFRPVPEAAEYLSDRGVAFVREKIAESRTAVDAIVPEPGDVALPKSIRVEPAARGIRVEFPRSERSLTDTIGWVLSGFMGMGFTVFAFAGEERGFAILPLVMGLAMVAFFLRGLRESFRQCRVDAGPAGLDSRRGYFGFSSHTYIPRLEVDYLEVRPTGPGGGSPGTPEPVFEIAAVRSGGAGRFVLGENVRGVAAADTLVRRIGRALALPPEKVLGAAGSLRRQLDAAGGALPLPSRKGRP
jgi:hypothetical protein